MRKTGGNGLTLVLGGTGKTGRRVAERLAKRGLPFRIGSRSGRPPFDWENRDTWLPVLADAHSAYIAYYADLAFPGAAGAVRLLARMAAANGVRRLVLLSGRGEAGARLAEQAVRESGAEWTIVRASWFSQDFSEHFLADGILRGELAFPAPDAAEPFVDLEDVADVAAAALTEDRHSGRIYEVTGPRLLTFAEAAAEISKATGRNMRCTRVSYEQYAHALLDQGILADFVPSLIRLLTTVLDGRNSRLGDGVQRALDRKPRDFADYARDAAPTGVWDQRSGFVAAG